MKSFLWTAFIVLCSSWLSAQQWVSLGPAVPPTGRSTIGQISCVAFNAQNPLSMWAGAPSGGLWSSSDGGQHWLNANIDTMKVIGISDIWVNPADSMNIILALGDRDENSSYVMRGGACLMTVDGGANWIRSGEIDTNNSIVPIDNFSTSRVVKNTATGTWVVGTSVGLFSSTNYGLNWNNRLYKDKVWDLKIRSGGTYIYAVLAGHIYRSANGGQSFSLVSTGLPSLAYPRIQLAVSPANQAVVYALFVNNDGTYAGCYKSNDFGTTWSLRSSTPNIMAANTDGSGSNGINNLALCVSPTNENILFAGGVNIWKSLDGGVTWTMSSHYLGTQAPFVSANIHDLSFAPAPRSSYLYASTGSGVFMSNDTGRTWQNYSNGLQVAQFSMSANHPVIDSLYLASGPTGVYRYDHGSWKAVSDSGSSYVQFDPNRKNVAFMGTRNGRLYKSQDTGKSFTVDISPTGAQNGVATVPFVMNPLNSGTFYAALRDIWRTSNGGSTWIRTINSFNANIVSLCVAPSDTNMVYMVTSDTTLYRSTNGGATWDRMSTIPFLFPTTPRAVYVHPKDSLRVCVIGGRNVSMSTDGGKNWQKYTLSDFTYINCMYWKADNCGEELILGTSNGIHKLEAQFQFGIDEIFGSDIPNSPVNHLDISGRSLRAATAGRGLYAALVDDIGVKPDFSQDKTTICPGEYVQFYDQSQFGGLLTNWTFDSGIPSTSTDDAPLIRFDSPGDHWVKLVSANGCGRDSIVRVCITVVPKLRANVVPQKTTACVGDTVFVADQSVGNGGQRTWDVVGAQIVSQTTTGISVLSNTRDTASITLTLSNNCGTNAQTKTIEFVDLPEKPTVTVNNDTMSVNGIAGMSYQWYVNNNPLSGGTTTRWVGQFDAHYFVRVTSPGGCKVFSDTVDFKKTIDTTGGTSVVDLSLAGCRIMPNPATTLLSISTPQNWQGMVRVSMFDLNGVKVLEQEHDAKGSQSSVPISIDVLPAGTYTIEIRQGAQFGVGRFVKISP